MEVTMTPAVEQPDRVAGCWSRIGVQGDRSCEQLAEHVHCRNCPVYSTGARALLDRPLPDPLSADRTRQIALARPILPPKAHSIVIFLLGADWLALPTHTVLEVASERPVHSLPNRRDRLILGIANVRGELLTCVSLERLLGLAAAVSRKGEDQSEAAGSGAEGRAGREEARLHLRRLLVFQHRRLRVVAHVEGVHGVHDVAPGDLKALPDTIATPMAAYSRALISWHGRSVGLLDADLLFDAVRKSLA